MMMAVQNPMEQAFLAFVANRKVRLNLFKKPEMPTLKELSARVLGNLILDAVTKDTEVSNPETPIWRKEMWLAVKKYLNLPDACMEKLDSVIISGDIKTLNVNQAFLVWWLVLSSKSSNLMPQFLNSDQKNDFSQHLIRFLSSSASEVPVQSLQLELSQGTDLAGTLQMHPNLKSCLINTELLEVLSEQRTKLQELHFVTHLEISLLPAILLQFSETLTTLNLSGIGSSNTDFSQMIPALRKCDKLIKLSLNPIWLVNCQWKEQECLLPAVSHLILERTTSSFKVILAAIPKVFPNLIHLVLKGISIMNTDEMTLLKSLGHCLKEMVCFFDQVSLSQILQCCPVARKLTLLARRNGNMEQEEFSLPNLQEFSLTGISINHKDFIHIIRDSSELKNFSLNMGKVVDFNPDTVMEMVEEGNDLRQLETLMFECQEGMSEQLVMSLMTLPEIKMIGTTTSMDVEKRLLTTVKAKGLWRSTIMR